MTTVQAEDVWKELSAKQPRITEFLRAAGNRPSASYLFVGPKGRGKTEAALRFAAAILCPEGCGHCEVCDRVLRGLHPDVQMFEPEGFTFPVEMIREAVTSSFQTPLEANSRVLILQEAHRIVERSQNALLKALEEPSSTVTWILTAEAIDPLLPTIISRCQVVEFPPPTAGSEASPVETALTGELESLALRAATHPDSSAVWALEIADELGALGAKAKEVQDKRHKVELAEFDETLGSGRTAAAGRKRLVDRHKRVLRRVETQVLLDFLESLATVFRKLAEASVAGPDRAAGDSFDRLSEAAERRPMKFWVDMIEVCLNAQLAIHENATPMLQVEAVLLQMVAPAP